MDQVLRLLRATCVYCNRLKLKRVQVDKYACQLRLVRYGLLKEARDLEDLTGKSIHRRRGAAAATGSGEEGHEGQESESESESDDDTAGSLMEHRARFVQKAIACARVDGTISTQKTEATANARRAIIQDFMQNITKSSKCQSCKAINHKYRKDRFVKIFRKALSEKERVKMIQAGHKAPKDAVVAMKKREKREKEDKEVVGRKRKRGSERDEGVADMDRSSSEEEETEQEEEESEESSDEGPEIAGGNLFDEDAGDGTRKKRRKKDTPDQEYLNPSRVHAQLVALFEKEDEILNLIYGGGVSPSAEKQSNITASPKNGKDETNNDTISADMFFLHNILVPPNRYRPEARTGSDEIAEAQENTLYKNILSICESMAQIQREIRSGKEVGEGGTANDNHGLRLRTRTYADLENTWTQLQDAVNSLIDRDRNPLQGAAGRRNADGIKQKLEKKEGMFRKYMMGKRVNFAARTVISPDPNIETNEIGIPPVFAVKLTYPEPVTHWNAEELQECVRNGAFVWPGAVAIESEDGRVVSLERKTPEERTALANQLLAPSTSTSGFGARGTRPKKVHRHLNNGDIVIMNRQPTLHKPSMMCHRARVLPGEKTLRMHYANCNTYNADFDGDEMNLHFPQNEVARAEALGVADTDRQYLSGELTFWMEWKLVMRVDKKKFIC